MNNKKYKGPKWINYCPRHGHFMSLVCSHEGCNFGGFPANEEADKIWHKNKMVKDVEAMAIEEGDGFTRYKITRYKNFIVDK